MSNWVKEMPNVLEAYVEMESIPEFLLKCTRNYNDNVQKENQKFEKANKELNENYEKSCQLLSSNLEKSKSDAELRKNELFEQLYTLSEDADNMVSDFNENVALIPAKKGNYKIGKTLNGVVERIKAKEEQSYNIFSEKMQLLRKQVADIYKKETEEASNAYEAQFKSLTDETQSRREYYEQAHKDKLQELYDNAVNEIISCDLKHIRKIYEMLEALSPSEINFDSPAEIPETIQIGSVSVNLSEWAEQMPSAEQLIEVIKDNYSYALRENEDDEVTLQFPVGRPFSDSCINQAILFNKNTRKDVLDYIKALEMRFFMSMPCGKLRVTMLDPVDLGANFSMFSCLGDIDERIISTKIWSEESRIEEQLNLLINQIEHVNQDCLRDEFANIVEYNAKVGKSAEPYQVLFVADFPKNLNEKSISCLEKIISSGPKCGIYTIIASAVSAFKNYENFGFGDMRRLNFADNMTYYNYGNIRYSFVPITLPKRENTDAILTAISNGIKNSGKIVINYDEISENLTQHKEKWFRFSCRDGIDIPIGLEGARRSVNIHLGGENITQHHALISGTTGAGKSTLLHTIIMSILLRYSPEDVQIMLLDFKRGVEFKSYAKYKLPNFRIISIDTEPEFGLSVFRAVNNMIDNRANEFRNRTNNLVDNIEQYNIQADQSPFEDMERAARIVIIVDEFQEMFADENSPVAKECKALITNIVKQGRAFGVHLILASQTLPDILADVYSQMRNRIALQSTEQSAKYILASDNEGIITLANAEPGKGIFNDGAGNKDANHHFRVAMFTETEQKELLQKISERQKDVLKNTHFKKTRLLLSTIQDDEDNPLNRFVMTGDLPKRTIIGCPLYIGEEISVENSFGINLSNRRAQNLLILGSDAKRAELIYGFAALSILFNEFTTGKSLSEPIITFFDFNSQGQSLYGYNSSNSIMDILCENFPDAIRIFGRNSLLDGIEILADEYKNSDRTENHYIIFAGLNRAKRLTESGDNYTISPMDMFKNLIKDGPQNGFNYIIWANEPSGFMASYDNIISEFDYRLVYDLTDEQYMFAVHSTEMKTNMNSTVISYNPDDDNKKVRIYNQPLQDWLNQFIERLKCDDDYDGSDFISSDEENDEFDEFDEFGEF